MCTRISPVAMKYLFEESHELCSAHTDPVGHAPRSCIYSRANDIIIIVLGSFTARERLAYIYTISADRLFRFGFAATSSWFSFPPLSLCFSFSLFLQTLRLSYARYHADLSCSVSALGAYKTSYLRMDKPKGVQVRLEFAREAHRHRVASNPGMHHRQRICFSVFGA